MNTLDRTIVIDAEVVMRQLLRCRTMKPCFKFPLNKEQAKTFLLGAVKAEVVYRHHEFKDSDELQMQLDKMAEWLTCGNGKFGMLLCGGCGNGKSTLMKALQQSINFLHIQNQLTGTEYSMRIVDAKTITYFCKTNYKQWEILANSEMLAIDDLGVEAVDVLDYGNIISPVVDLLIRRYEGQLFTIITTNLTPPEISKRYGERIADRLREMMERIVFANNSFRDDKS